MLNTVLHFLLTYRTACYYFINTPEKHFFKLLISTNRRLYLSIFLCSLLSVDNLQFGLKFLYENKQQLEFSILKVIKLLNIIKSVFFNIKW